MADVVGLLYEDELRKTAADRERLREALEMIAGRRQCTDNLMSNIAIAIAALDADGK